VTHVNVQGACPTSTINGAEDLPMDCLIPPDPCLHRVALQPVRMEVGGDDEVIKVCAGARHTVLLCSSGVAYACGAGKFGQLGSGVHENASKPQPVAVPAGGKVVGVATGWWHTLILVE
jgi:alpha-tubulin suppressor-like RCC1 family protein